MIPEELREKRNARLDLIRSSKRCPRSKTMVTCETCCIEVEKRYYEKRHKESARHKNLEALQEANAKKGAKKNKKQNNQ